jgi:hypothetical protein
MRIALFVFSLCVLIESPREVFAKAPPSTRIHSETMGRKEKEENPPPVYDVKVVGQGHISDRFRSDNPYTSSRPKPFYYKADIDKMGKNAFLIAGINCDSTLEREDLTITGLPIKDLERLARPQRRPDLKLSNDGFILENTGLKELLLEDNRSVRAMGLSHQQVAEPLIQAIDAFQESWLRGDPVESGVEFTIDGQVYTVRGQGMMDSSLAGLTASSKSKKDSNFQPYWKEKTAEERKTGHYCRSGWLGSGLQGTPFNDDLYTDLVIQITNPNGQKLVVDGITPHMAYRYGFYQGNPSYRTEPKKIAEFFGLKRGEKEDPWKKCQK